MQTNRSMNRGDLRRPPGALERFCFAMDSALRTLAARVPAARPVPGPAGRPERSEEHTSELQSRENLVCLLLLEKKKADPATTTIQIMTEKSQINNKHQQ